MQLNHEEQYKLAFLKPCSCTVKNPDYSRSRVFSQRDKVWYSIGRYFCPWCKKEYVRN